MDEQPVTLALRSLREQCARAAERSFTGDLVVREADGTEHRVVFRRGTVVDVRIAGLFDPILKELLERGALDPGSFVTALEALGRSQRRAGDIARDAGVQSGMLRAALRAQGERRFSALLAAARERGRDACLRQREVRASDVAFRLEVQPLIRRSMREGNARLGKPRVDARVETPRDARKRGAGDQKDRRALRRLAFALHPDRHPHVSDAERERLARRLAEATARFHEL